MAGEFLKSIGGAIGGGSFLSNLTKLNNLEQQAIALDDAKYQRDVLRPIQYEAANLQLASSRARAQLTQMDLTSAEEQRATIESNRQVAIEFMNSDKKAKEWAELNVPDMNDPGSQDRFMVEYYKPMREAQKNRQAVFAILDTYEDFEGSQQIKAEIKALEDAGHWEGVNAKMASILRQSPMYISKLKEEEDKLQSEQNANQKIAEMEAHLIGVTTNQEGYSTQTLFDLVKDYAKSPYSKVKPISQDVMTFTRQLAASGSTVAKDLAKQLEDANKDAVDSVRDQGRFSVAEEMINTLFTGDEKRKELERHEKIKSEAIKIKTQTIMAMEILKSKAPRLLSEAIDSGDPKLVSEAIVNLDEKHEVFTSLSTHLGIKAGSPEFLSAVTEVAKGLAQVDMISKNTALSNQKLKNPSQVVVGGTNYKPKEDATITKQKLLGGVGATASYDGSSYKMDEVALMPGGTTIYPSKDLNSAIAVMRSETAGETMLAVVPLDSSSGARNVMMSPVAAGGAPYMRRIKAIDLVGEYASIKDVEASIADTKDHFDTSLNKNTKRRSGGIEGTLVRSSNLSAQDAVKAQQYFSAIETRFEAVKKSGDQRALREVKAQLLLFNLYLDNVRANNPDASANELIAK